MRVKAIMSRPVITVRRKNNVKETIKKMVKENISCVVVAEKKIPIGIFTKRDLLGLLVAGIDLNNTAIESVMRTPVMPIGEGEKIFAVARQMDRMEVRRFIIVDKSNRITGIVTDTDIVRKFASREFSYQTSLAALSAEGLTATPKTSLKKIAGMMLGARKSSAIIIKNRKPVGIVTESLFVKLATRHKDPLKASTESRMIKKITMANIEGSSREAVINMINKDHRNLICVDEKGRYTGTIDQLELVHHIEKSHL